MLCVVATKVEESKVAPIWIQEAITMHSYPPFDEPYKSPFAEIFVTTLLRRKPGSSKLDPQKGECDFAFIHHGCIRDPEDVGTSFNGGKYGWVNQLTPNSKFGTVKRGLNFVDHTVEVSLEPLDFNDIRFDISSPVKSTPITTRVWTSFPEDEKKREKTPFTLIQARPLCSECSGTGCCIARMRFTANGGVEEGQGCVKYPAYGPTYVARALNHSIENLADDRSKKRAEVLFRQAMFDTDTTLYDLAMLGSRTSRKYEIIGGYQHQQISPFFAKLSNGENKDNGVKKLVHYFTPKSGEGNFMIAALSEGLIESDVEKAIRIESEKAARGMPPAKETIDMVKKLQRNIKNNFSSLED